MFTENIFSTKISDLRVEHPQTWLVGVGLIQKKPTLTRSTRQLLTETAIFTYP